MLSIQIDNHFYDILGKKVITAQGGSRLATPTEQSIFIILHS